MIALKISSFRYERFGMWALPEIVVLMPIIWIVWVKNMMAIFRTALNRESSALLKMSDMVGTVSLQKPRRLQRFKNESSFARSDAEQRPDHAGRQ